MNLSPDASTVLRDIHELRAARQERLARDLEFIDAAHDRVRRRLAGDDTWWALFFPVLQKACTRTCYARSVKKRRRRLAAKR